MGAVGARVSEEIGVLGDCPMLLRRIRARWEGRSGCPNRWSTNEDRSLGVDVGANLTALLPKGLKRCWGPIAVSIWSTDWRRHVGPEYQVLHIGSRLELRLG